MKIYFAGSICGGRQKVEDYQKIVHQFEKNGHTVLTKHVADDTLTIEGSNIADKDIYIREGKINDPEKKKNIDKRHKSNLFKLQIMPSFDPGI